ncbi:hypothetical protein ACRABX_004835, partial [Escherichia coli]
TKGCLIANFATVPLKQEAIEKLAERIDQHLDHVSELFDKTWSRWHDCHFQKTTAPVDWA